ncbi:SdiA-regulated domain-containing protein [Mucilaginibacter agri]|uniref:SdiA-regulated family protein n=1 Tax=Mucilaginibacter agri TaxID=2695265 RepID=A0A965ZFK4_9SPHI|nr:SdiA-regulated domain-containing protein [Mucilaginibacter agri]NCD68751.1 SdiA-regulated family protein [Mucilaginibacter agri]
MLKKLIHIERKKKLTCGVTVIAACVVLALLSCQQRVPYLSPAGYDLNKPQTDYLPDNLEEVSGIAFNKGNPDLLYAEEDENGRVYYMKFGDKKAKFSSFKKTGDFEDIAIAGDQVIMLQSKGRLFTFPISEVANPKIDDSKVQEFGDMLPKGEFEGLYADEASKQVYVLCKHCDIDKTTKQTSGFIFNLSDDGKLTRGDKFEINVRHIANQVKDPKVNFRPSALAQNPKSKNWFVLSSVNKLLVILNPQWKVLQVFHLNPSTFPQPEGIAFDNQNNLYISNEGDKIETGTVLKFKYMGK